MGQHSKPIGEAMGGITHGDPWVVHGSATGSVCWPMGRAWGLLRVAHGFGGILPMVRHGPPTVLPWLYSAGPCLSPEFIKLAHGPTSRWWVADVFMMLVHGSWVTHGFYSAGAWVTHDGFIGLADGPPTGHPCVYSAGPWVAYRSIVHGSPVGSLSPMY